MRRSLPQLLLFTGLTLILFSLPFAVHADPVTDDMYQCPPDYPEGPAFTHHLEQEDLVNDTVSFAEILDVGEILFTADFNACDGQGRPATTGNGNKREAVNQPSFLRTSAPDSNSCSGCHNEPRVGGGGDFVGNVFVLAQTLDPVTESVNGEFSNERNSVGMFGAGPIEMLAREMTAELLAIRDLARIDADLSNEPVTVSLAAKGVNFGSITVQPDGTVDTGNVRGVDHDLIIKPFHQAGKVVSLREFTNNAMNHHHGMQSEERFDLNPAKDEDYDEDGVMRELTIGDITAVTIWQAALPTPGQLLPDDNNVQAKIKLGLTLFEEIGCGSCHIPELPLNDRHFVEPNPYNPAGNWVDETQSISFDMTAEGLGQRLEQQGDGAIVRAYTDMKRHDLCDDPGDPDPIRFLCNEQLAQERPDQDGRPGSEFFLTRKLWDVGNSGPYGHRGDLTTITAAIMVHGGEARAVRDAFAALPTADQAAIISFLKTLQVLPESDKLVLTESDVYAISDGMATPMSIASSGRSWVEVATLVIVAVMAVAVIPFALRKN
jgi:hypothetical protein